MTGTPCEHPFHDVLEYGTIHVGPTWECVDCGAVAVDVEQDWECSYPDWQPQPRV